MGIQFQGLEKTQAVLLYIVNKLGGRVNFHKIFKILYFADQKHLVKYGDLIIDDAYMAMENGPVPSLVYDGLKSVKEDSRYIAREVSDIFKSAVSVDGHIVTAEKDPDLDELSSSEIECLDESIKENKNLSYGRLKDKSHDLAWQFGKRNFEIPVEKIAEAGGADKEMIKYVKEVQEAKDVSFC